MAVALRLSRGGSKKRPYFRIVAADIRAPRDGRYLERLGTYNPMKEKNDPERVTLNTERIKYWLSVGAKPTERVQKFLAAQKLAEKPTITKQTKQDKPKKKTLEKIKAKEEKLKAKQDEAAKATEKPAEAPPAPEQATTEKPAEASSTPEQATAEKSAEASPTPEQATAEKPAEASPAPEQATTEKTRRGVIHS
ncbi:MAG: 30S ribosomal protein S16 [Alphaproteobacteria bacterium]